LLFCLSLLINDTYQLINCTYSIPTIAPMEELHSLAPQQVLKTVLQVHFHHHLLPLKLFVFCDGKRHPVKLHLDIAYFVRPLPMDLNAFLCKENQLRGMFEYARRLVNVF
jgi:AP-3 complex subunit beta